MKVKSTKSALLMSFTSLLLCFAMLIGTTFAWFTDSVTSGVNTIKAGNLDIEVSYFDKTAGENGKWVSIEGKDSLFDKNALWEPGHTEYVTLKIENKGNLALNYKMMVSPVSENGGINVAGQNFKLSDYLMFGTAEAETVANRDAARALVTATATGLNQANLTKSGTMEKGAGAQYVTLVVYMPENVGNEANYKTGTTAPSIELGITVVATQKAQEADSFNTQYDAGAITDPTNSVYQTGSFYNYFEQINATKKAVKDQETEVTKGTSGNTNYAKATVPANGAEEGADINLNICKTSAPANFEVLEAGKAADHYEVNVTGATAGTLITVEWFIGKSMDHVVLYHNGAPMNCMKENVDGVVANGDWYYNAGTGVLTMKTTSFSPFSVVYDEAVAVIGNVKYGTLAAAVADVATDKTVTLLKNCAGDGIKVAEGRKFTIDFNGFTYNIDGTTVGSTGTETNGFQLLKNSTITFKNGKLTSSKAKILIQNYCNLTLDNMVLDGTKLVGGGKYAASNNNGTVMIKNTTINAASDGVAFDVYSFGDYTGANVTVQDSVINGRVEVGVGKKDKSNQEDADTTNLGLSIESGTINGDIVVDTIAASKAGVVSITGGTFSADPAAYLASSFVSEKVGNNWVVGKVKAVEVEVTIDGTATRYDTWNEAIEAVKDVKKNISMKILNSGSAEPWGSFVINGYGGQSITIDGNGQTITGLKNMLFSGTWAGAGLTVKNLTIDGANIVADANDAVGSVGVGAVVGMSDSSAAITIENVTVKNSHIEGGHWTGGLIGYVTGYNKADDGPVFNNTVIKNCTVSNNEITGKGSCGALIGHACGNPATKVTVNETAVSGNTVTCTGSSTNKAGYLFGTVGNAGLGNAWNGEMGGVFVTGCTVSSNTAKSGSVNIERVYGRIVDGKLTVDGTGYTA